jgi:hypothetical protein
MRVGRNEACPCGSKKKFKSCCAGKTAVPKGLIVLLAVFAIIAGIAFIPRGDKGKSTTPLPPASRTAAARPGPQPPGPVPPGKVWSVEHGHWHDINAAAGNPAPSIKVEQSPGVKSKVPMTTVANPVAANVPQPAGPVPPGKVWSPQHGHWHDAQ